MTHNAKNKVIARFDNGAEKPPDRYLLLTKTGELLLIRADDRDFNTHTPEICFSDSYIFETLEDIYWQPKASNLCAHLHPPTSYEMAVFMVQRYIIPVMRDLEIIQCGLEQAIKNDPGHKPMVSKAARSMFDLRFHGLEKARALIYKSVEPEKPVASPGLSPYDAAVAS